MDNGSTALPYWKDYQVCVFTTSNTDNIVLPF